MARIGAHRTRCDFSSAGTHSGWLSPLHLDIDRGSTGSCAVLPRMALAPYRAETSAPNGIRLAERTFRSKTRLACPQKGEVLLAILITFHVFDYAGALLKMLRHRANLLDALGPRCMRAQTPHELRNR